MKKKYLIFSLIIMNNIIFLLCEKTNKHFKKVKNKLFKGVYRIDSVINGYSVIVDNNYLFLSNKKEGKEQNFRINAINY